MGDEGAGAQLEHFHGQVVRRAVARRGVVELAGVGLGVGDEVFQRLRLEARVHHQRQRETADAADVGEVFFGVEGQLAEQVFVESQHRVVGRHEGAAVGLGGGYDLRADVGGRARAVVDHHLLAQRLAHGLGHGAGQHVGAAAGRVRHDPAQRLVGQRLGGGPGGGRCGGAGGDGFEKRSAVHGLSPVDIILIAPCTHKTGAWATFR